MSLGRIMCTSPSGHCQLSAPCQDACLNRQLDTPTKEAPLYPWMPQFYCDDMYWLVTVESLPRALFCQEADARRFFDATDPQKADGTVHLWMLNGGHLCRPPAASKELR